MTSVVARSPLPSRHAVRTLVEPLIGRDVQLTETDPIPGRPTNLVAAYVTDDLSVSAVAVLDLEGAARLGGALGMLPKVGVDDAVAEMSLSDVLRANAFEVLNVLAAVFNVHGAPHVRLYELYGPEGSVPGDVLALSHVIGSRMDLLLTVAGYGEVRLSIITR